MQMSEKREDFLHTLTLERKFNIQNISGFFILFLFLSFKYFMFLFFKPE